MPEPSEPSASSELTVFPDLFGRTRRFSLGAPRSVTVSPDGDRVLYLRSAGPTDPRTALWCQHPDGGERALTAPEVGSYATDRAVERVAFSAGDTLWTFRLGDGEPPRRLPTPVGVAVHDPVPSPDGDLVAYLSAGGLRLTACDGTGDRALADCPDPQVTYGHTDHTAHESIGRQRAYWWAPDGRALLVARVDLTPVARHHLHDPTHPGRPPRVLPYPATGTANSLTTLDLWDLDGGRVPVALPAEVPAGEAPEGSWGRALEYLVNVDWSGEAPLVVVQSRDQQTLWLLRVDPESGACTVLDRVSDPYWVEPVPGLPGRTASGTPVFQAVRGDVTTLRVGESQGPSDLHVREFLGTIGERVLFSATDPAEPTSTHVWSLDTAAGPHAAPVRLSREPGVHFGTVGGRTHVLDSLTDRGPVVAVHRRHRPASALRSVAADIPMAASPRMLTLGRRALRARLHLPAQYRPGTGPLPVLLAPYGGPGMQIVTHATGDRGPAVCQWYAEHGFAVLSVDGRGTPGRGLRWLRAIHGDRLTPVLEDQIDALHAAAELLPDTLDLGRVGIYGWSFGGYLAAGAVLHHPETFHVAVAGAPPTDHRLYDTYWNERHLGHPALHPEGYARSDLIPHAHRLVRPLMLIHGLADDNVLPVHTLRLSAALQAAGRPHTVHLLPDTAHHPGTPELAADLLRLQLSFLTGHLHPTGPEKH
ncbi:prolyl oligopeptidase family serine peptidase [Streptomyces sp. XM4193]|uniref:S9 family peptidase n=1 Tax=Streptomyces sp. XM4193 TaxID=2929782 RepID=UPI001FF860B9|nr:prolyl oligopeptidase family serine peptidase [Streptomyces sp. XM4193]MCK1795944.1 prolyl oligopeptidase family serine peptidase [Streptomyces sp. XM4193]